MNFYEQIIDIFAHSRSLKKLVSLVKTCTINFLYFTKKFPIYITYYDVHVTSISLNKNINAPIFSIKKNRLFLLDIFIIDVFLWKILIKYLLILLIEFFNMCIFCIQVLNYMYIFCPFFVLCLKKIYTLSNFFSLTLIPVEHMLFFK